MLIDTHCHLNFQIFNKTHKTVIEDCLNQGIGMIIVGTNYANSIRAMEIAAKYKQGVYASVGVHPVHLEKQEIKEENIKFVTTGENFNYQNFQELIETSNKMCLFPQTIGKNKGCGRILAVGETGLDYQALRQKDAATKEKIISRQKQIFIEHIKLATDFLLPLIIHARGSNAAVYDDLISILSSQKAKYGAKLKGVVHAFNGTLLQAQKLVGLGFYLGINGALIDNIKLQEVLKDIPIKKILLETDAPFYLIAGQFKTPNNPQFISRVNQEIAAIYGQSIYETGEQTAQNAFSLFNILA